MVTPVKVVDDLGEDELIDLINPEHIAFLLNTEPISAWGMRSLDVASRCVKTLHPGCREHVHDVRKWLNAVLESTKTDQRRRRYFVDLLFNIEMKYGLYHEALATIKKALSQDKDNLRFYLMHADVLSALKRLSEARAVLTYAKQADLQGSEKLKSDLNKFQTALIKLQHKSIQSD